MHWRLQPSCLQWKKDNQVKDVTCGYVLQSHLVVVFFPIVFGAGDVWFPGDSRSHPKLTAICLVRTDLQRYKKSNEKAGSC